MDVHPMYLIMENGYFNIKFTFFKKASTSFKNYLVTGGKTGKDCTQLTDSTELFTLGSWQETGRMPYAVYGLVGTSLDNNVYMLGLILNIYLII